MTHTYLLSEDDPEDYNPCGLRPVRYLMLNFEEVDLQVGIIVGDIVTRVDLLYKALEGSQLLQLLA